MMSNQTVYQFIAENQNELLQLWTDTLKELSEQESYQLTDQVYENISKEYIDILLLSVKDENAAESQISELALRAVQIGLSLKFLATALAEFWKRLYTKMNDKRLPDQESTELIWQIDRFFSPINTEIFNQYSISWEKTVSLQKIALQELSAPLIPVFENITVMPLVGTIDTERAKRIMENLLNGVVKHRSQVVLIDITGVPVVDTMVAHHIIQASEAVRLVGAKCLLAGIRPEIAQTIVNLGIDLSQVITKNTLQKGIQTALEMTDRKIVSLGE
ncbi:RsbT co-antagonist protein RsbRA [Bacillus subtilis]|uniref:RsbT co-antagonist protein RsbRA n=1 Tax=Bacillus TaxID=1386 RepID=UPI0009B231AB|nr:RsbT co-antagonist protein RsbRA [Bacillus subtilis]MCY7782207.1 RsbT co-antagonist protein RsbRA [Bacillus sp. S20C3]MCY8205388.1 RsbT co-antagonist protein RsbRA [Bacillus sp. N12A5]MCY8289348.1 RsbT co-antagonist protein RsbRA [Bacillus sp. N13C7]MCY8637835.1 RsbT co-antagonist protein RsbRA [Bacillus sp. S17B2]MCY8719607.1 RsbT co-antagonist protein RsbRA [Bacillus sp. S10C12M]MCY9145324.1 RsbT co-antagonist protein RsbRA [Bacillus sp. T9C1]